MACATVSPAIESSFVYEHLINHVKLIQNEIVKLSILLNGRIKSETSTKNKLKCRSFTFIDPFSNSIVIECRAHEYIKHVVKQFKKDYIPKYLAQWIRFGTQKVHCISELSDCDMQSTVSDYMNGSSFITYGELIVWFGNYENSNLERLVLKVSLMDGMKTVISKIAKQRCFTNIELKSHISNENKKPNETDWNEAKLLSSEDTIMSSRLYEKSCVTLAKYTLEKSKSNEANLGFDVFMRTLTGKTLTVRVNSSMAVETLKQLVESIDGTPSEHQRFIFSGKQLENGRTIGDYNIQAESTLNLVLCLRGGMYHFTSGRQDFKGLPHNSASAVKDVLSFDLEKIKNTNFLLLTELQDSLLEAQSVLSNLYSSIKDVYTPQNLPNLKEIMSTFNYNNNFDNNCELLTDEEQSNH